MFFWKYFGSYLLTDDHYNQHVYMKDKDVNESQSEPIFYILHNPLYFLVSSIKASTSTSLQNGNCYYSSYLNSVINFGSSNTFFNRNVINTISNKTCYCSYDNSSTNDLCNNASFDKIIKTLAIQNLMTF